MIYRRSIAAADRGLRLFTEVLKPSRLSAATIWKLVWPYVINMVLEFEKTIFRVTCRMRWNCGHYKSTLIVLSWGWTRTRRWLGIEFSFFRGWRNNNNNIIKRDSFRFGICAARICARYRPCTWVLYESSRRVRLATASSFIPSTVSNLTLLVLLERAREGAYNDVNDVYTRPELVLLQVGWKSQSI
jgi:hypothetical protein